MKKKSPLFSKYAQSLKSQSYKTYKDLYYLKLISAIQVSISSIHQAFKNMQQDKGIKQNQKVTLTT